MIIGRAMLSLLGVAPSPAILPESPSAWAHCSSSDLYMRMDWVWHIRFCHTSLGITEEKTASDISLVLSRRRARTPSSKPFLYALGV